MVKPKRCHAVRVSVKIRTTDRAGLDLSLTCLRGETKTRWAKGDAPGTTNFWSSVCSMSVVVSIFEVLTSAILREHSEEEERGREEEGRGGGGRRGRGDVVKGVATGPLGKQATAGRAGRARLYRVPTASRRGHAPPPCLLAYKSDRWERADSWRGMHHDEARVRVQRCRRRPDLRWRECEEVDARGGPASAQQPQDGGGMEETMGDPEDARADVEEQDDQKRSRARRR